MIVWLQFLVCTLIITFAGAKLSKYGDVIAEKTGVGRTWIGVALMASVTSLPELITGISSVTVLDLPDIAAGDVLGSCMFNLLIIAALDFKCADAPITAQANQGQVLPAAFGALLLALVGISMAAGHRLLPAVGWVGLYSFVFLGVYLLAMRIIFLESQRAQASQEAGKEQYEDISKKRAFTIYGVNALLVIAAATWLPYLGEKIAEITGLGHTFVGSLFIALSTSLPEVVVSFSALKMGAPNLALGNLFGSNLFNIAILAMDDLAYTKGPLFSHLKGNHTISTSGALVLTSIIIIGLIYRPQKKHFRLGWDSIATTAVFILTSWLVYLTG